MDTERETSIGFTRAEFEAIARQAYEGGDPEFAQEMMAMGNDPRTYMGELESGGGLEKRSKPRAKDRFEQRIHFKSKAHADKVLEKIVPMIRNGMPTQEQMDKPHPLHTQQNAAWDGKNNRLCDFYQQIQNFRHDGQDKWARCTENLRLGSPTEGYGLPPSLTHDGVGKATFLMAGDKATYGKSAEQLVDEGANGRIDLEAQLNRQSEELRELKKLVGAMQQKATEKKVRTSEKKSAAARENVKKALAAKQAKRLQKNQVPAEVS